MAFQATHVLLTETESLPRGSQLQMMPGRPAEAHSSVYRDSSDNKFVLADALAIPIYEVKPERGNCPRCEIAIVVDLETGKLAPHAPKNAQFGICEGSQKFPKTYVIDVRRLPPDPKPPAAPEPTACDRCPKFCPYCGKPLGGHKHD